VERQGYCSPRALSLMFPNSHKDYEIRALTRKAVSPLPHVKHGSKRPVVVIHPAVYALYLQWEQGLISYEQVVDRARRYLTEVR